MAFAGRVLIKLVRVLTAVVAGILLWVAGIQAGVIRNPLDPALKGDIELGAPASTSGGRTASIPGSVGPTSARASSMRC